jgi:precorrin-6A/cobalt-precorrin-6A reductase
MRILILGGTAEAVELADRLVTLRHRVTTALAGRTRKPHRPKGRLQVGGFGGTEGLERYLSGKRIDYLVDATHPFAVEISRHAVAAAKLVGIPLLRVQRPPWTEPEKAGWVHVADEDAAAAALLGGATVLLTIGRQRIEPFLGRSDCRFVLRAIEAPQMPLPGNFTLNLARPPFSKPEELALMRRFRITCLVTKNSGGAQTAAKLDAADFLKVRVIMIDRPELPAAPSADSVEAAMDILGQLPAPGRRFVFF